MSKREELTTYMRLLLGLGRDQVSVHDSRGMLWSRETLLIAIAQLLIPEETEQIKCARCGHEAKKIGESFYYGADLPHLKYCGNCWPELTAELTAKPKPEPESLFLGAFCRDAFSRYQRGVGHIHDGCTGTWDGRACQCACHGNEPEKPEPAKAAPFWIIKGATVEHEGTTWRLYPEDHISEREKRYREALKAIADFALKTRCACTIVAEDALKEQK